ncbi:MAG: CopD family protein [Candidatus Dormibacteria bacterium]
MVGVSGPALVLWVHIVAACIWIGGQVTVAVLIPLLRDQRELARRVGRRYQAVAWPAFAVLIVTGVVNAGNAGLRWSQLLDSPAGRTLVVKLGLVALSGLTAGVHAVLQAPRRGNASGGSAVGSAVLGSISLGAALLAALYGVAIAGP